MALADRSHYLGLSISEFRHKYPQFPMAVSVPGAYLTLCKLLNRASVEPYCIGNVSKILITLSHNGSRSSEMCYVLESIKTSTEIDLRRDT